MQPDLLSFAARVEELTGPDREVDAEVWCIRRGHEFVRWDGAGVVYRDKDGIQHWPEHRVADATNSVDAVLALIEREFPGWRCRWQGDGDGVHEAFLENRGDFNAIEARHTRCFAATPALALLSAALRAKAAQQLKGE